MVHPIPSMVVEILSKSTKSNDRGVKFKDYAAHGIPEYWIVDYQKQTLEQYVLENEKDTEYTLFQNLAVGQTVDCHIIKGFSIPVAALFDEVVNLNVLKEMMA